VVPRLLQPNSQEPNVSTTDPTTPAPKTWAILELFGHARIAGEVREHSFGGETFTRVDVPEVSFPEMAYIDNVRQQVTRVIPGHTKLFGGKAVYSLAFVDEAAALAAAHSIKHEPIKSYTLRDALAQLSRTERQALLAGPDDDVHPF
jgi:hypothetical protein